MHTYLILGNIFSLLSAICIAISVIKQKRFYGLANRWYFFRYHRKYCALCYATLVISIICFIQNILSYQNRLTKLITIILLIASIIIGLYANNLAIIGLLPIIASASYTICIYVTKNEQQMRWALTINMILWFIHNLYVQAYPSAIANIVLCAWTFMQIYKYRKQ